MDSCKSDFLSDALSPAGIVGSVQSKGRVPLLCCCSFRFFLLCCGLLVEIETFSPLGDKPTKLGRYPHASHSRARRTCDPPSDSLCVGDTPFAYTGRIMPFPHFGQISPIFGGAWSLNVSRSRC